MTAFSPFLLHVIQAPSGGLNGLTGIALQIGFIFLLFWVIIIRPQQKQKRQHEQALRDLKKGDEIVTSGGIVAEVIYIKETVKDGTPTQTMEDRITVKSAESRMVVERGRIARVVTRASQASPAA
jgi:preprotein translocase subunit YajC